MKKSCKCLILLGATTLAVTMTSALQTNLINKNSVGERIQAYYHNPSNILDNIFTENGEVILPFIFPNAQKTVTEQEIKDQFKRVGLTVKNISTGTKIGTGTEITVQENSKVYKVLIYGDVNGDGIVDLGDAQKIILHKNDPVKVQIKGIYFKAANLYNKDNVIDLADAQRIVMFKNGTLKQLVLIEPQATKDTEKPVITLNGNKTETIEVGSIQSYKDPGVTAKDNFDGNIPASDIKVEGREKVNTKVVGKYLITYTTTDSHGNKGTATRTINVVDTVKPVIKLNGLSTVTVNVGESYNEEGATATDNYYGNLTSKIVIGGDKIDSTTLPGEYKITYDVTDGSNNKADTVIRTVIVKDFINSIEMVTTPRTNYNYGETELDLTGAELKINWKSSPSSNISITDSMIVKDYDMTQVGKHTITVKYEEFVETFEINICDKISEIELLSDGRQNVSVITGGYRTNSKEEFVLGTLKSAQKENVSTLQENQIQISKRLISSEDTTATVEDLTISTQVDEQGNILLKGNCAKTGNYEISVSIAYGSEKIQKTIDLQVTKNNKVKEIVLEEINDNEIKHNQLESVKKLVTVKNVNDEDLEVTAKELNITNITNGMEIRKLDTDKDPIVGDETIVKYLEITTTLKQAQEVAFSIQIENTEVKQDISFRIGDELVLSKVEFGESEVTLNTEVVPNAQNIIEKDGKIYTVLQVNFYNQDNDKIEVLASDIQAITEGRSLDEYLTDNQKMVVVMPKVERSMLVDGELIPMKDGKGTDVIFLNENGKEVNGETPVEKIGVAIESAYQIELDTLNGKKLQFVSNKIQQELPIKVNYKEIKRLTIDESVSENVTVDGENRIVETNKEFTLGKMQVGTYEGPLTTEMLKVTLTPNIEEKLRIFYEVDANKNILIKGEALQEINTCQITPFVEYNGKTITSVKNIFLKAVSKPTIQKVELDKETENGINIEIGRDVASKIKVVSNNNPSGEKIKIKDINIEYDDDITIEYLDSIGNPIPKENTTEEFSYLRFAANTNKEIADASKDITITLYKGETNEYKTTKKVNVYNVVSRKVDIAETVQIYDTENTETVVKDGKVYTLIPVKVYADEQKTKPITVTANLFGTRQGLSQILVTVSKVSATMIELGDVTKNIEPVKVAYFDSNKEICTSGNVSYIGFAYNVDETKYSLDKSKLNECEITFKCEDNSQTAIVMVRYEVSSGETVEE